MSKYIIPVPPFEPLAWELEQARTQLKYKSWQFQYTLFGSSVMYLYGLRDEIGDIDMFVTRTIYDTLKWRGWQEQRPREEDPPLLEAWLPGGVLPVHAFYGWKKRGMQIDVQQLLNYPEYIGRWPVQSLRQLRDWKLSIAHHDTRPNDYDDVDKINKFLGEE